MATSSAESPASGESADTGLRILDIRWDSLDAAEKALICNVSDERGPEAAAAHIVEVSEGTFSEADVTAFLIEKCT